MNCRFKFIWSSWCCWGQLLLFRIVCISYFWMSWYHWHKQTERTPKYAFRSSFWFWQLVLYPAFLNRHTDSNKCQMYVYRTIWCIALAGSRRMLATSEITPTPSIFFSLTEGLKWSDTTMCFNTHLVLAVLIDECVL